MIPASSTLLDWILQELVGDLATLQSHSARLGISRQVIHMASTLSRGWPPTKSRFLPDRSHQVDLLATKPASNVNT